MDVPYLRARRPSTGSSGSAAEVVLVNRFSLRFTQASTEESFAIGRSERLARGVYLCVPCMLVCLAIFVISDASEREAQEMDPDVSTACYVLAACMVALSGLVAVSARLQQRCSRLASPLVCEMICVVWCVAFSVAFLFTRRCYMALLVGVPDARPCVDALLALQVNAMVSVSHVLLPVRWCVLWPMEVACFAIFLVPVLVYRGNGTHFPVEILTLALLVVLEAVGTRNMEQQEREAFLTYLQEKTLRVEAEFRLSQKQDDLDMGGVGDRRLSEYRVVSRISSQGSSAVSTSPSGRTFEIGKDGDLKRGLAGVVQMGTQERWLLPSDAMRVFPAEVLGSGSFGIVVRGEWRGTEVALKIPRLAARYGAADHTLTGLANELRILRHVKHPNIVLFYGAVVDAELGDIALVLELVRGRSLDEHITRAGGPTVSERFGIVLGVSRALQFMHAQIPVLVHGDIKSSNILVQDGGHAKLLDFGLSRVLSRHARPLGGTLRWMAPEVFRRAPGQKPNASADVFSFGCVLYFVATGNKTQHGVNRHTMVQTIRMGALPPLPWPEMTPFLHECRVLVDRCTLVDAHARPKMEDVLEHLYEWSNTLEALQRYRNISSAAMVSTEWYEGLERVRKLQNTFFAPRTARGQSSEKGVRVQEARRSGSAAMIEDRAALWQFHTPNSALASVPELPAENNNGDLSPSEEKPSAYKLTPAETQRLMLADVMLRWYLGRAQCCTFHLAIQNLTRLCAELKTAPCKQSFAAFQGPQCPQCGVLDVEAEGSVENKRGERECDVCGYSVPTDQGPRSEGDEPEPPQPQVIMSGIGRALSSERVLECGDVRTI